MTTTLTATNLSEYEIAALEYYKLTENLGKISVSESNVLSNSTENSGSVTSISVNNAAFTSLINLEFNAFTTYDDSEQTKFCNALLQEGLDKIETAITLSGTERNDITTTRSLENSATINAVNRIAFSENNNIIFASIGLTTLLLLGGVGYYSFKNKHLFLKTKKEKVTKMIEKSN